MKKIKVKYTPEPMFGSVDEIPEDLKKFKGISKEKKVTPEQKKDWFEEFCDKNKQDNQWHRTFNNESMQWSFRLAVIALSWLGATIVLSGVIFWLLRIMLMS